MDIITRTGKTPIEEAIEVAIRASRGSAIKRESSIPRRMRSNKQKRRSQTRRSLKILRR